MISKTIKELVEYKCAGCHGDTWKLKIAHSTDGSTSLVVSCADEKCLADRRREEGAEEDSIIIWDEFDISDSSYANTEWDRDDLDPSKAN